MSRRFAAIGQLRAVADPLRSQQRLPAVSSAVSGPAYFDGACNTSSVLNAQTPTVKAVGSSAGGGCLSARGGQGTFYAEAINEAEVALVNDGTSGARPPGRLLLINNDIRPWPADRATAS